MPDGSVKRKKVIKRITKKLKELTREQLEEIDVAFELFDKDKSGTIDIGELKDAMKALGVFLKKEEVRETMRKVDKDGSGAIDRDEFRALMAEQIEVRDQEKEFAKVFRIYDDDDNGLITSDNLMRCAGELDEDLTKEISNEMIRMADLTNKGGVDNSDFMRLLKELDLIGEGVKIKKKDEPIEIK